MRTLAMKRTILSTITTLAASAVALADAWSPAPHLNGARGFSATTVDECGNIWAFGGMHRTAWNSPYVCLGDVEKLEWMGSGYAPSWTTTSIVMPTPRMGHQVVCAGGFIYVLGGYEFNDPSIPIPILRVDRLDWRTGIWDVSVPDLPLTVSGHASVVDKLGRIWVIGGTITGSANARSTAFAFDPVRPQLGWQSMPSLQTERQFPGATVDQNGRIWVIGGADSGYQHHLDTVETIDPCSPTGWTVESPRLPAPISNSVEAALGADGLIYISGGWATNNNYMSSVCRIDPRIPTATWESRPPMNLARNEHNLVLGRDGRLYALGGEAVNVISQTNVESMYTGRCTGDLNNDRTVGLLDLTIFLSTFGTSCQ